MKGFTYNVFYHYDGPSLAAPLRSKKSEQEVSEALARVAVELPYYFPDQDVRISKAPSEGTERSMVITIMTTLSEAETNDAMAQCLNNLDLYGRKLMRD